MKLETTPSDKPIATAYFMVKEWRRYVKSTLQGFVCSNCHPAWSCTGSLEIEP